MTMHRFFAAVQFLTIVPVPAGWGQNDTDLARSTPFFPLVGLLIGAVIAVLAIALGKLLPTWPASVLIVTALFAASGGLHMDGLADAADGLLSARPRGRMLEIMRDSRIGTMGATAVACILCLKMAVVGSLNPEMCWRAVLLMPVAGRCALVLGIGLLPYVRADGGLGELFYRGRAVRDSLWAVLILGLAGWLVAGVAGLAAAFASLLLVVVLAFYTYRKIGGATGDTLGASCEIVEIVPALFLTAWPAVWF